MNDLFLAVILLILALVGVVARKTYFFLPIHELKRRAEKHDHVAAELYRAAAYGNSLKTLLWLYVGLTGAGSIILLARELPVWASLLIVGPVLWATFSLVPATRLTGPGVRVTVMVTPPLVWLLNYLHPLLGRGADAVEGRYVIPIHTRIFEKEDLLRLVERQQHQPDSRISEEELEIVRHALTFDEQVVGDILTSRKKLKTVLADDTVGPVLIDELHKSGQPYILVREKAKGPVIGTLDFSSLGLKSTGKVRDVMDETVYYVHENDTLSEALHAFFVTNHPMFIVVNSFEEFVGIITVENILHQLLGHIPGEEFDQYANLSAVAAKHEHKPKEPKKEAEPSEILAEPAEVKE
jgi:CBS domain containing-hemolysin-like protein